MGVHTDVRDTNVLRNGDTGRAMVIDFEQALLTDARQQALSPVVPNKRARYVEGVGINKIRSHAVRLPRKTRIHQTGSG